MILVRLRSRLVEVDPTTPAARAADYAEAHEGQDKTASRVAISGNDIEPLATFVASKVRHLPDPLPNRRAIQPGTSICHA